MTEPAWLEAIKSAFLADRASVFLLHGPGTAAQWPVGDGTDDFTDALVHFLSRTREVVGLLDPPQALRFPGIGDVGRFERMVAASFLLSGTHLTLQDDVPEQALGKLWVALSDATTPQGYVVGHVDSIYPAQRRRVAELGAEAPPLWDWCHSARIREANHIVLLVTRELSAVRPELVQTAEVIAVGLPTADAPAPEPVAAPEPQVAAPQAELADGAEDSPADPPSAPVASNPARSAPAGGEVDLGSLVDDLNTVIRAAVASHDEAHRLARVPVLAGVATLLGERTGSPGPLQWALDEDGKPTATGDGAEDFLARWRSDIALDASAGMVLKDLGSELPDRLNEVGLRALAKRLIKKHL